MRGHATLLDADDAIHHLFADATGLVQRRASPPAR
jgi:hypothetical protein